jgi:hypothetical protein
MLKQKQEVKFTIPLKNCRQNIEKTPVKEASCLNLIASFTA